MKYIKTFEDLNSTRISIKDLMDECLDNDIDFFDLISEMILNNIISFQCFKIYDDDDNYLCTDDNITGRCEDVKLLSELASVYDYNILVKMNNKWYELTSDRINYSQSFFLYNHKKGKLEKELELVKITKKFSI